MRVPDLIVLFSCHNSIFAPHPCLKEANNLGIVTVGLVDSNCDPRLVSYPVPGNDDSPSSVRHFGSLVAAAILAGKRERAKLLTSLGILPQSPLIHNIKFVLNFLFLKQALAILTGSLLSKRSIYCKRVCVFFMQNFRLNVFLTCRVTFAPLNFCVLRDLKFSLNHNFKQLNSTGGNLILKV